MLRRSEAAVLQPGWQVLSGCANLFGGRAFRDGAPLFPDENLFTSTRASAIRSCSMLVHSRPLSIQRVFCGELIWG